MLLFPRVFQNKMLFHSEISKKNLIFLFTPHIFTRNVLATNYKFIYFSKFADILMRIVIIYAFLRLFIPKIIYIFSPFSKKKTKQNLRLTYKKYSRNDVLLR